MESWKDNPRGTGEQVPGTLPAYIEYCCSAGTDKASFPCRPLGTEGGILKTPLFFGKLIPDLLRGLGNILSVGAISQILKTDVTSVHEALAELEENGVVCRRREYNTDGWTVPDKTDGSAMSVKWIKKLSEYVLLSPGATVPEIMMVLKDGNPSLENRAFLLTGAMRQARENGDLRLLSNFITEIMRSDQSGLTEQQAAEVLTVYEPRKFRNVEYAVAEGFVKAHFSQFKTTEDRVLALMRLGELELLKTRLLQAERNLKDALKLSMEKCSGCWVPGILSALAEIPRDFEGMKDAASLIETVIGWLPELDDSDINVRILATAASALAGLGMSALAEKTILSAMTQMPVISLETQQVLEWCRAKVFIASGRKKAAMIILQRALLLAENINDQLAVMEVLNTIVFEMKERPVYTVRSLISIMQSVSKRTSTSRNLSNRLYALDHMVDMYTRTLQFDKARKTTQRIYEITGSPDLSEEESMTAWCQTYLDFLSGEETKATGGEDLLLPGTGSFLKSLAGGIEPIAEAGKISEHLLASPGNDFMVYALILAMEAFARGFDTAASSIAAALDSSSSQREPFLSWRLCISGILASKEKHADDFFQSAQILARQLDMLLLVWLVLRCRIRLSSGRDFREAAEITLLLAELDEHIRLQLSGKAREEFMIGTGAEKRFAGLRISAESPEGGLRDLRDEIEKKLEDEPLEIFRKISEVSGRISSRTEISASIETLGVLTGADRVLVLGVRGSEISIIEGYGTGRSRFPCSEVEEIILQLPQQEKSIDNFGRNAFGSRRYMIIPTEKSVIPARIERKLHSLHSRRGNYVLIEMNTPFNTVEGTVKFFINSFCRQIGCSLLLRDRESMAYIDTLTGSDTGHSWMKRLLELKDNSTSAAVPLSVFLVDVDGLSEINNLFGFRMGDKTLKILVSTIKGMLRPGDIIGRLKEDLFGVLLPGTREENTSAIAERICGVIAGSEIRPDRVPVTVSIGAAVSSSSIENPELIVSRAYAALQKSKDHGGNRAIIWSADKDTEISGVEMLTVFNTGDPGWDYSISTTIMELLTEDCTSLEIIAEKLRNALRSEFIYLEDGEGNSSRIGSRILSRIPEEISPGPIDRIKTHFGILGGYDAISTKLSCGGRLISAWNNVEGISGSLKNVFRALGSLSSLLLHRGSFISGYPPEAQP